MIKLKLNSRSRNIVLLSTESYCNCVNCRLSINVCRRHRGREEGKGETEGEGEGGRKSASTFQCDLYSDWKQGSRFKYKSMILKGL